LLLINDVLAQLHLPLVFFFDRGLEAPFQQVQFEAAGLGVVLGGVDLLLLLAEIELVPS
jgi:hypothetical protein